MTEWYTEAKMDRALKGYTVRLPTPRRVAGVPRLLRGGLAMREIADLRRRGGVAPVLLF